MYKIFAFSKSIKDFRLDRKKLHPAENIVLITVLAVICGAEKWEEIQDYGNCHKEFLSKHLDLSNGVPSHDTFNRFFSLFNPEKFQKLFFQWIQELLNINISIDNHIAIDGKSSRGTKSKNNKMLDLLNAFLVENQCVLAQQKTDDKSNEITAIPELLKVLDIQDAYVSIDAIGCQKEIAEQIVNQKGNYFLAVKQNHKILEEDIQTAFKVFKETPENIYITEELNGSRIEKRTCKVMTDLTHLSTLDQWIGLKALIKIESEVFDKSKKINYKSSRYYICNKEDTAEKYLKLSRNHWAVENKLHWNLDVIFKEDQSRKRNNNVAENFSVILKVVLKILKEKQKENKRISIPRMRKKAGWDIEYLINLMNF